MRIGLIADIHGNLPGLVACWEVLQEQDADLVVCLGDLVQFGPYPCEVIDFVRRNDIEVVQGNCDRAAGRGRDDTGDDFENVYWQDMAHDALLWTEDQLSIQDRKYLKKLPVELRFRTGRRNILCVHGLPGNVSAGIPEKAADEVYSLLLSRNNCDVLALGHTHGMFLKAISGGMIINPGSVGGGTLPGTSTFAILDVNEETGCSAVSWQRVPFDIAAFTEAYRDSGLPDTFMKCILSGRDPRGAWHTDDINRRRKWAEP